MEADNTREKCSSHQALQETYGFYYDLTNYMRVMSLWPIYENSFLAITLERIEIERWN